MTAADVALLVTAGVAAGLAGSIAGLASLASYPALLAVGLSPVTANVTNTVSLVVASVGSVAGSRPELSGQAGRLRRFVPAAVAGGVTGCALLLLTPSRAFELVVPFLIAAASLTLLLQRWVRRLTLRAAGAREGRAVRLGVFAISVYGGYFGAAAGVLLLALFAVVLDVALVRANALKNVLLGAANAAAAVGFAIVATVDWRAALPLAAGVLAGSSLGPGVARRLPATPLRVGIGLAGLALAVVLFVGALHG